MKVIYIEKELPLGKGTESAGETIYKIIKCDKECFISNLPPNHTQTWNAQIGVILEAHSIMFKGNWTYT